MSERNKPNDLLDKSNTEEKLKKNNGHQYGLSEARYREMRQNFIKADETTRATIAQALAQSLYDDIKYFAVKKVGIQQNKIRITSVAQSTWLKLSGTLPKEGALENYESLDSLMALIRRMIFQVIVDKYRVKKRQPMEIPKDDEGNPIDITSKECHEKDVMERDVADRLHELLNKYCEPHEVFSLAQHFCEGLTYREIVEKNDMGTTPDALRMSINRLLNRLGNIEEFKRFAEENNLER